MGSIKSYKDLLIWQKGIQIVKESYLRCENLPNNEVFGLQQQIKRSAVSIPSNIAEGYGRNSTKNYVQFLRYSLGSLYELETQVLIAKELEMINETVLSTLSDLIVQESKMLNAFIFSVQKKKLLPRS